MSPLGEPGGGGGLFTGGFDRQATIWKACPLGSRRDVYYKKGLEMGVVLHWCPVGRTWRRESFTGDFERTDIIFTRRPCSLRTPRYSMYEKGLETGISLHRGPVGELQGGLLYRGLWETRKRRLWKRCVPLYGSSMRGTWRVGSFTGNWKVREVTWKGWGHLLGTPRDGSR